ncbi:LysR family transcriptional regulator [Alkalihalobacillus sp. LMS6]|uniref:LysR family transcriptional regulator n=1 Tax=Alkalihalobacillus sp. LMS6 TaxID=2924034 RepID=UPI0020D0DCD3|nr:LysR family transcriptional regulator [Alkalihalobacillus sp. LMS6]UTR05923.1 LysR family transcriptional regulator [Alkalihalobacillus sp. LMS6]
MNMNWIRTFIVAAQVENFYQTAEMLYVSQPTVTVHIKQLEQSLGVPLFSREGRNIFLTDYGRAFLPHAIDIQDRMRQSYIEMDKKRQGYNRLLRLAVSPLIATTYLPYWIRTFVKQYPSIEVVVDVVDSTFIEQKINQHEADVGLTRQQPLSQSQHIAVLQSEPLCFVVPHDGGDAESSPPISLENALGTYTMLTYNHPDYWKNLLLACRAIQPRMREMKVSHIHVTKRFIEEGIGCSILPRSAVRRELAEGRMLEVNSQLLHPPVVSTYFIERKYSEEARAFRSCIEKIT